MKKHSWTKQGAIAVCLFLITAGLTVKSAYQITDNAAEEKETEETANLGILDASVAENTYHETEPDVPVEYETEHGAIEAEEARQVQTGKEKIEAESSSAKITLEAITELQARVSASMSNGELPFVSSSAVYENPYRLHIVVSSNAERDLSKLKAFDTIGGALEIEYNITPISAE